MHILEMIWGEYEDDEDIEDVVARWSAEKIEAIEHILREYQIVTSPDKNWTYLPTQKFRLHWRQIFNRLIREYLEMYEYSAACAATIYLLNEFSMESMSDEELRDGTIILCERWFFAMAECAVTARRFMRTKRLYG